MTVLSNVSSSTTEVAEWRVAAGYKTAVVTRPLGFVVARRRVLAVTHRDAVSRRRSRLRRVGAADATDGPIRLGILAPRGERAVLTVPIDTLMRVLVQPLLPLRRGSGRGRWRAITEGSRVKGQKGRRAMTRFETRRRYCASRIWRQACATTLRCSDSRNADWGDDNFTSVNRDAAGIYLCRGAQGHPGTWAWIGVEDVQALYEEYRARGARRFVTLHETIPGRSRCTSRIPMGTCCASGRAALRAAVRHLGGVSG